MPVVVDHFILPQDLVGRNGEKVVLTVKGKHRCKQISDFEKAEWEQTMQKLKKDLGI